MRTKKQKQCLHDSYSLAISREQELQVRCHLCNCLAILPRQPDQVYSSREIKDALCGSQRPLRRVKRIALSEAYNLFSVRVALYMEQGGLCAGCQQLFVLQDLALDHNHETHYVRGLLCRGCNTGIGHLKENPFAMMNCIHYVRTGGPAAPYKIDFDMLTKSGGLDLEYE